MFWLRPSKELYEFPVKGACLGDLDWLDRPLAPLFPKAS